MYLYQWIDFIQMDDLKMRLKKLTERLTSDQLRRLGDRSSFNIWASHLQTARSRYTSVIDTSEVGFSCYSQSNEDGIIDFLATRLGFSYSSRFLEIGTQDYAESNTRFLYTRLHCEGTIVDCCSRYNQKVRRVLGDSYWKGSLKTVELFLTLDNIKSILDSEYDLISLDIDGNDFWILSEILTTCSPKILVCEYNPLFAEARVCTPYTHEFDRKEYHYSHLVFGMSLSLAIELANRSGLVYIGSNSLHNNAFFVREDCLSFLPDCFVIPEIHKGYNAYEMIVQEGRNAGGDLQYMNGAEIASMLADVEVCHFSSTLDKFEMARLGSIWK